jgi:CubicO group peptidase (beta-lactamase class C family)
MITQEIIEREEKQTLDHFVTSNFYAPLGLSTLGFKPRQRFPLERIIPTENDVRFRKQLLQGDVHDPAAAMKGGVSGHAGVFSNANDLAIIMQMLLNGGQYGGKRFIQESTVAEFTKQQYVENENRRGIVFDKPEVDFSKNGPTAHDASSKTFGHTGFTGTCMWADPEHQLVFVFLSNRVNPDANNSKLSDLNVRTNIQQVVYDAILKNKKQ